MTKTNYIIVCDNAFISKESNSLNIIEIFDRIGTAGFPAVHPRLVVVTSLSGSVGKHEHKIIISNVASGESISEVTGSFTIERAGQKAQFIGYFKNIVFPSPGEYAVKIFNDGELQDVEEKIYVG